MVTNGKQTPNTDSKPKSTTIELRKPTPKKNSVRFSALKVEEGGQKDQIVTDVYVSRLEGLKLLGVSLDNLKGVRVTIEPIAA